MQATAKVVLRMIEDSAPMRERRIGGSDRSVSKEAHKNNTPTSGLTPGEQRWKRFQKQLRTLSTSLRRLKPLRKLDSQIGRLEEQYGGQAPIRDDVLTSWTLANATIGTSSETVATIVAEVAKTLSAPKRLIAMAEAFASSYCGFYKIVGRRSGVVYLEELVTEDRFAVRLSGAFTGPVGAVWWVRLVPNADYTWTALDEPYLFRSPDASVRLRAYFERSVPTLNTRTYRRFLREGQSVEDWLAFVVNAYVGSDKLVYLDGVPDRSGLMDWPPAQPLRSADPRYRARTALLAWAERNGWTQRAVDAFRTARRHLGLADQCPLLWSPQERVAAQAFALYGYIDDRGRTALDAALTKDSETLDPALRTHLESIGSGYFSVFEVTDVDDDASLGLRDVLRRRHVQVDWRSVTRRVRIGDVIAGWLTAELDGIRRLEPSFMQGPVTSAARLVETMRYLDALFVNSLPELAPSKRLGMLAPYAALAIVRLSEPFRAASTPVRRRRRRRRPAPRQLALFDLSELEWGGLAVTRPLCASPLQIG